MHGIPLCGFIHGIQENIQSSQIYNFHILVTHATLQLKVSASKLPLSAVNKYMEGKKKKAPSLVRKVHKIEEVYVWPS